MTISNLLKAPFSFEIDDIGIYDNIHSRKTAIQLVSKEVSKSSGVSVDTIFKAFYSREKLGSTMSRNQVVLPQAIIPANSIESSLQVVVKLFKFVHAVEWEGSVSNPKLMKLMISFCHSDEKKLARAISYFNVFVIDASLNEQIMATNDKAEIFQLVENVLFSTYVN